MERSPAIERLLDSLSVRLFGLVAIKVAGRMAVELAAVQRELLNQAQMHRDLETQSGDAVADRLEAMIERIARDWTVIEEPLGLPPLPVAKERRSTPAGTSSPVVGSADARRPRGRPRKTTNSGDPHQNAATAISSLPDEPEGTDP